LLHCLFCSKYDVQRNAGYAELSADNCFSFASWSVLLRLKLHFCRFANLPLDRWYKPKLRYWYECSKSQNFIVEHLFTYHLMLKWAGDKPLNLFRTHQCLFGLTTATRWFLHSVSSVSITPIVLGIWLIQYGENVNPEVLCCNATSSCIWLATFF
jgi:hypothetical protein